MRFEVSSKNKLAKKISQGLANPGSMILISNKEDLTGADKVLEENRKSHLVIPDQDILCLNFDDVLFGEKNCMTDEDAKNLIDFVNKICWEDDTDVITVCCDGGVSRSASVAMFFDFEFNHSIDKFLNLDFSPNPHVINTLRKNFKNAQITEKLIEELSTINLTQFRNKKLKNL